MNKHADLPPSSSDKWINCHGWLRQNRGLKEEQSEAAAEGVLAHTVLELKLLNPESALPEDVPADMEDLIDEVVSWIDNKREDGYEIFPEQRVDYGEQFGYVDLFGTSDVVGIRHDRMLVADLKYGRGQVEVQDNFQMLVYLAGVTAKFGRRPEYELAVLQPRGQHKHGKYRAWILTDKEFGEFLVKLEAAIAGNYNGGKLNPGDHCRKYCKAMGKCPAIAERAIQIFRDNPL
jgi:hypothetical protein